MKINNSLLFASLAFLISQTANATIIFSGAEPTANILLDQFHFAGTNATNGRVGTNISSVQGRGSLFSLDTNALGNLATAQGSATASNVQAQIENITIQLNNATNLTASSVDVIFFDGTPAQDFAGSGVTAANFITDSGITILSNENHVVPAGASNSDFLTVNLNNPFVVNSSNNIGVMLITNGGGANINHFEGQNAGGGRIAFTGSAVNGPSSRDFNFLIGGVVIPEPSALIMLGLASLGLGFLRHRRQ